MSEPQTSEQRSPVRIGCGCIAAHDLSQYLALCTEHGEKWGPVRMSRVWAMPSRHTFTIPPIAAFLDRWLSGCQHILDPMCGESIRGTHRNDWRYDGIDAEDFCETVLSGSYDAVLFDPPYSPRQIQECYRAIGIDYSNKDTQNAALYSRVRKQLNRILKPGGIALSFGWNSTGMGAEYRLEEILLVPHGGAHNDTICVAQRKPA